MQDKKPKFARRAKTEFGLNEALEVILFRPMRFSRDRIGSFCQLPRVCVRGRRFLPLCIYRDGEARYPLESGRSLEWWRDYYSKRCHSARIVDGHFMVIDLVSHCSEALRESVGRDWQPGAYALYDGSRLSQDV